MAEPSPPQTGDKLHVIVEEVHPAEVKVRLADGSRGRIIRRELTWDRQIRQPERLVKVGDRVEVIVLPQDRFPGFWELSLRQAQGEPWAQAASRFHHGSVARGRVVSILHDRVYVQVIPGVDASVLAHHIPLKSGQTIKDALWIGDRVVGVVTHFAPADKRMQLSINKYLERVEKIRTRIQDRNRARKQAAQELAAENALGNDSETLVADSASERWISLDGGHLVRRILIVDDDAEFYGLFSNELRRMGYEVETAETIEEGYAKATSADLVDMAFLDLDLMGGDGLQLAHDILVLRPSLPVIILTALGRSEYEVDLDDLGIVDLLSKPPDYQMIRSLFNGIAEGAWARTRPIRRATQEPIAFLKRASSIIPGWRGWEESVRYTLDGLLTATSASCIVLFEMDPVTDQVRAVARSGHLELNADYDWNQARYSPIQDVIQGGEQVFERDAKGSKARGEFRNLHPLLPFSSCIGVPVPAPEQQCRHGLFLFHILPQFFSEDHATLAAVAAHSLALAVERQEFAAQLQAFQQFLVAGQIGAGLMHDLSNQLMGLETCFKNLELTIGTLSPERMMSSDDWEDLGADIKELGLVNNELSSLARFYLELIQASEVRPVDANDVIEELARHMRREARAKQVEIVLELGSKVPRVYAARGRLQQAFLNVALNAIQHIGLNNPQGGVLVINSSWNESTNSRPIQITFSDDGPGIHRQLFERIFERGVSSRKGGSGLGLYISRILIESIGGRIRVEDSTLFVGSSFLVGLAAMLVEGERHDRE